jgi:hypothetical protein
LQYINAAVNIKEKYDMARLESYEMDKPTPITRRGYLTLKLVMVMTVMYAETLALFAFIGWLGLPMAAGAGIVVVLLFFLRGIDSWCSKKFDSLYEVATDVKDFSYVRTRAMKEAV